MCKLAKYVRNCVVFWKNLHSWQKFYTTAGRDGRDKFQVCVWYVKVELWSTPQLPRWPRWTARQKELWPSLRALFLRGEIASLLFKTCRTKSIKTTLLFDTCVLEPGNKDNTRARSQWPWTELEGRKNHILQNIGNSCCVYLCFYCL